MFSLPGGSVTQDERLSKQEHSLERAMPWTNIGGHASKGPFVARIRQVGEGTLVGVKAVRAMTMVPSGTIVFDLEASLGQRNVLPTSYQYMVDYTRRRGPQCGAK